ncbi:MAG: hypothetical protein NTY38_01685 [Acidobacteria bacterium]|nr:hypothetical protein [Acidobacteriota bacterium]
MKRKPASVPEPVIADEILENAKKSVVSDKLKRITKCIVCNDDCAPTSAEGLCWVCRRLKISAWREGDPQISAQE